MKRGNCFFFALWLWYRNGLKGKVAFRLTRPPIPFGLHWVYIPDGKKLRIIHYEPKERKKKFFPALVHMFWYEGRVRHYDTEWKDGKSV